MIISERPDVDGASKVGQRGQGKSARVVNISERNECERQEEPPARATYFGGYDGRQKYSA